ncbi:MAG: hypothetical protein ACM3N4_07030, partial [Nitrososphaerota archaeon]
MSSHDVPVLELEPPKLGGVKIEPEEPELFELAEPVLLPVLEPLELLELVFDAPLELEDALLDVTELADVEALCV